MFLLLSWCWLLVVGDWLLVVGYWLLVIGYWLLVIFLQFPGICLVPSAYVIRYSSGNRKIQIRSTRCQ
ncbi:MAG: hypothetical protein WCO02_01375 [Bacteroidota bacterium]